MNKCLISLFDYSGNASKPYKENGWNVIQIDIQHGINILDWDYEKIDLNQIFGIMAAIPCTDYALSGAKHFLTKDIRGNTQKSQVLVQKVKDILEYFNKNAELKFWYIENPMSRIHTLNTWMGKPRLKFHPYQYALFDPVPNNSRYCKQTWLWGKFLKPYKFGLPPLEKDYPGYKNLGGKSIRTKNLRSITPLGFSYAFYDRNR